SYEIKKIFIIWCEMHKFEPIVNEKTFVKKHVGNTHFVNRIMCFINEAQNYIKSKQEQFEYPPVTKQVQ
ncbi:conserved protein, unknown function, partial [Hepatocystis sp. ex Piliocolobus tephrosceles]